MQLRHMQVGIQTLGGVRLYGFHTFEGFDNDVLPTTGFARTAFELEFR
jgi:hypothetical protein